MPVLAEVQGGPALEFDAEAHRYMIGGVELPGVTQVLELVGLIDYSHIPWPTRQIALERGRAAHEAIALDLEADLDEGSAERAGVLGYIHAARAARQTLGIKRPDAWEHRAYHPKFLYAGTIDLIYADLIVDWKTDHAEYWVRFQLAAYAALVSTTPARIRRICVELHEDGRFRVLELARSSQHDDFQTFLAALRVHQEKTHRRELR